MGQAENPAQALNEKGLVFTNPFDFWCAIADEAGHWTELIPLPISRKCIDCGGHTNHDGKEKESVDLAWCNPMHFFMLIIGLHFAT